MGMGTGKQLYIAAHDGNIKAMKSALSNGADINWENPDDLNYTPLHIAACFNKLEADSVQFLIRNNANIESRDTSGFTPLMRAAVNGSSQSLIILLQNGANATAINNTTSQLICFNHLSGLHPIKQMHIH
uniref:Uncharacterized protein n=1 Tax=Amphimedon queenslandica TaxID=400682 RepID=A0A1X7T198_AMPQE